MSEPASRKLSPVPEWLLGIMILPTRGGIVRVRCRQCDEVLCSVTAKDSLWILADVAHDHRKFCRDDEERQS